jgi:hypothetical protein
MCRLADGRTRTTFFISQLALLLFSLLHFPAQRYPQFHPDLMDGVRGLFLGIAIGSMALAARRIRRRPA